MAFLFDVKTLMYVKYLQQYDNSTVNIPVRNATALDKLILQVESAIGCTARYIVTKYLADTPVRLTFKHAKLPAESSAVRINLLDPYLAYICALLKSTISIGSMHANLPMVNVLEYDNDILIKHKSNNHNPLLTLTAADFKAHYKSQVAIELPIDKFVARTQEFNQSIVQVCKMINYLLLAQPEIEAKIEEYKKYSTRSFNENDFEHIILSNRTYHI